MRVIIAICVTVAAAIWLSPGRPVAQAQQAPRTAPVSAEDAADIAVETYIYAYPLVLAEVSRRSITADPRDASDRRPRMNQFSHRKTFPDHTFTNVVRPNADTLYSSLWYDVSDEPLVINVPDSQGRYYLLPMLDLWTDVFASPGTRTTGNGAQSLVICGPTWQGKAPDRAELLRSPTSIGWIIGRTQTNGPADFENVHRFQAELTAQPLSQWSTKARPEQSLFETPASKEPPVEQSAKLDAAAFFGMFAELLKRNPPHANDYPMLERMARIGIRPGSSFDVNSAPAEVKLALARAVPAGQQKIAGSIRRAGTWVNHWRMVTPPIGTYGTDYLRRAGVAYMGLGANVIEDSIYFTGFTDSSDQNLDSGKRYTLHFAKDQLPPVRAFWSLTVYNERQFFAENPIRRYSIGDRDKLQFAADGSLTLYIQRESPGSDRESNWLPAPAAGEFTMSLRLYWPKSVALDGAWIPPAVERAP